MISIARTFGAPETVPAGNVGPQEVEGVAARRQPAGDAGDDVHDVGVPLDDHQFVDVDTAVLTDAAQVVAAQIDEHGVFGQFLGVRKQLLDEGFVFGGALSPGAGPGDRPELGDAVLGLHHDLRARAYDGQIGNCR